MKAKAWTEILYMLRKTMAQNLKQDETMSKDYNTVIF